MKKILEHAVENWGSGRGEKDWMNEYRNSTKERKMGEGNKTFIGQQAGTVISNYSLDRAPYNDLSMLKPSVLRRLVCPLKKGSLWGLWRSKVNTVKVKTLKQTASSRVKLRKQSKKANGLVFWPVARKQTVNYSHFNIQRKENPLRKKCNFNHIVLFDTHTHPFIFPHPI